MITVKDFSFKYQNSEVNALSDINIEISDGDFVGIIGKSGSGKTTLTYALNGIVPHFYKGDFYGAVIVDGMDTVEVSPEKLSLTVGSVLQDMDSQMVTSVVEDEILFGLENFGVPRDEIPSRVEEALNCVGISELKYRKIRTLSGGQRQKVAIASILALKPKIIVLDEPTGELDPQSSRQVFSVLRELNKHGITVIVVEQKIMQLCEYCDKLIVMDEGNVRFYDDVKTVLSHADELEAIGVHVPRIVSLARILNKKGLYNGDMPVNKDEAVKMVEEAVK